MHIYRFLAWKAFFTEQKNQTVCAESSEFIQLGNERMTIFSLDESPGEIIFDHLNEAKNERRNATKH